MLQPVFNRTAESNNIISCFDTIGEHATVEHKSSGVTIKSKYSLLDAAMREAQLEYPVFFYESLHVKEPFNTSVQKYRFFNELQLTVPVDIIR